MNTATLEAPVRPVQFNPVKTGSFSPHSSSNKIIYHPGYILYRCFAHRYRCFGMWHQVGTGANGLRAYQALRATRTTMKNLHYSQAAVVFDTGCQTC